MNWIELPAYRNFEQFIASFVIEHRSFITIGRESIDLKKAFREIKARFVDAYDESDATFDAKVVRQFRGATRNTKLAFANIEYLWAMPAGNISAEKKRSYARRWLAKHEMRTREGLYLEGDDRVANPGLWYLTNKYFEILSICRILKSVVEDTRISTTGAAKRGIEALAHAGLNGEFDLSRDFAHRKKCGTYSFLLHLSNPERYDAIVSENHKERIVSVFAHVLDGEECDEREDRIRRIREKLYATRGVSEDPIRKRRWFFYLEDVKPLWHEKKSRPDQLEASITDQLREEETAAELEGELEEVNAQRLRRSRKLVLDAKKRDQFTCVACGFHYKNKIVQAHHLDPLSERLQPRLTSADDLVTLCPNCHYLAHYLLRKSDLYKEKTALISKLKSLGTLH